MKRDSRALGARRVAVAVSMLAMTLAAAAGSAVLAAGCATAPTAPMPPAAGPGGAAGAHVRTDAVLIAERFTNQLAAGQFEAATQAFAPKLRDTLDAGALRRTWEKAIQTAGPYIQRVATNVREAGPYQIVYVRNQFEREVVSLKVVVDGSGAIAGVWYLPLGPAPAAPSQSVPGSASQAEPLAVARQFAGLLRTGEFLRAASLFDATLASSLLPEQVAEVWQTMVAEVGQYQSTESETSRPIGELEEVLIVNRHARGAVDVRVAIRRGAAAPIAGVRITPHGE